MGSWAQFGGSEEGKKWEKEINLNLSSLIIILNRGNIFQLILSVAVKTPPEMTIQDIDSVRNSPFLHSFGHKGLGTDVDVAFLEVCVPFITNTQLFHGHNRLPSHRPSAERNHTAHLFQLNRSNMLGGLGAPF